MFKQVIGRWSETDGLSFFRIITLFPVVSQAGNSTLCKYGIQCWCDVSMKSIHFLYPIVGNFIIACRRPVSLAFNAVGDYIFSYYYGSTCVV